MNTASIPNEGRNEELSLDQLNELAGANPKGPGTKSDGGPAGTRPSSKQVPTKVPLPKQCNLTDTGGFQLEGTVM